METGIHQISQRLSAARARGSVDLTTLIRVSLAEVQEKSGQMADGLHVLEEAITLVETIEERFYETALHRLQGQLLLQKSPDNATEAESCFQKAISITSKPMC